MINRTASVFVSIALSGQLLCLPLVAQADTGPVKLGETTLFINHSGSTATIQENLDNALVAAHDRSPSAVHVVTSKKGSVITLGGYKIVTVDAANAKAAKTTAPLLAKKWADALRKALGNRSAVEEYVAQLEGGATASADEPAAAPPRNTSAQSAPAIQTATQPAAAAPQMQGEVQMNAMNAAQINAAAQMNAAAQANMAAGQPPLQGRVLFVPAGLMLPVTLNTSISTQVAQPGDTIQATLSQAVDLGNGVIPAGTVISGQVTDSEAGRRLDRSGELSVKFTTMRLPDGTQVPISTHIVGGIGKYALAGGVGSDTVRGETMKNKFESAAIRTAVGAGTGAALGTAIGAIAGGKHGVGKGAWSGTAIGGGVGLADSLFLRKAADVQVKAGTQLQVQLDAPVQVQCRM
jgi:hypothetical protein